MSILLRVLIPTRAVIAVCQRKLRDTVIYVISCMLVMHPKVEVRSSWIKHSEKLTIMLPVSSSFVQKFSIRYWIMYHLSRVISLECRKLRIRRVGVKIDKHNWVYAAPRVLKYEHNLLWSMSVKCPKWSLHTWELTGTPLLEYPWCETVTYRKTVTEGRRTGHGARRQ